MIISASRRTDIPAYYADLMPDKTVKFASLALSDIFVYISEIDVNSGSKIVSLSPSCGIFPIYSNESIIPFRSECFFIKIKTFI
jgi:hypothetical protein